MPIDLQLDRDTLEIVASAAAVGAAVCLLLTLFTLARLRALSKRVRRLASNARVPVAGSDGNGHAGLDSRALRHVGVVRYDAFGDMGGRLSFSAAMYDDRGDGLVISSINGRSETRTYAKSLVAHQSEHELSPEEEEAITRARPS